MTEKYARNESQWIKVIRDAKKRSFTLARGYKGNTQAHDIKTYPFAYVATWDDAMSLARTTLDCYK